MSVYGKLWLEDWASWSKLALLQRVPSKKEWPSGVSFNFSHPLSSAPRPITLQRGTPRSAATRMPLDGTSERGGWGWGGSNQAGDRTVGREVKQNAADRGPQVKEKTAGRGYPSHPGPLESHGLSRGGGKQKNLSRTPLQPLYLEPDLSRLLLPSVAPCWELAAQPSGTPYCWNLVLKEPRRLLRERHLRSPLRSQGDAALVWARVSPELNLVWAMRRWLAGRSVS